jgi:uncharacterized protein YkwD
MMKLAAARARELAERYEHTRPDGTRVSQTYRWGEIINRRADTPTIAVDSWLASAKGDREMILSGRYSAMGAGFYRAEDGTGYWVQFFSR